MSEYQVAIFAEGEYARTVTQIATRDAADKCAAGVVIGASLYGAGSIAAYVLPDGAARMREEQSAKEVEKVR